MGLPIPYVRFWKVGCWIISEIVEFRISNSHRNGTIVRTAIVRVGHWNRLHELFWQILVLDSLAQYGVEILFNGHHYPFDILTCGDTGMRGAVE